MSRRILVSLLAVAVAVILQTTVLARLPVFGVIPDLVLLTVVAASRRLDPEPAVVLGFTAGLIIDLLGSAPLGLRAMVLTVVAYAAVRTRERFEVSIPTIGLAVWLLALGGTVLLAIVGTLFGQRIFSDPLVFRQILLGPIYDVFLAALVLPAMSRMLGGDRPKEMAL